ncbi:MAG: UDP-3-O-(3-hydroxymyristoyl)glucosamine N-acyltransferase [Hyphomicrobiales bacterium]|nr:MAG: UDP-3-O-(3-hydroxymyristoyl)glucosamine N-acyltransferase [Hyphomicrobiales bacterium]
MTITLATLCRHLDLPVPEGKGDIEITSFKPLHEAGASDISFFDNQLYKHGARTTQAAAVLIRPKDADILPDNVIALVTPQPYVAFALALQVMYPSPAPDAGVSQFAVVSGKATVHPTARIEPYAVVYEGASIGAHVHIGAHTVVGAGVSVGMGTRVAAHVTLQKAKIGAGCIIHPGVRVGQDGFGFAVGRDNNGEMSLIKVPQIGMVRIGNDVEIGANSTIDCGALGDTIIEDMVKIDNQVQIGHNAKIGRGSRVVAQSGIAGSASLGSFTVIGGQSGVVGHVSIADKVMVASRSGVTKSTSNSGEVLAGMPAVPIQEWRKTVAVLNRLTKNVMQKKDDTKDGTGEE